MAAVTSGSSIEGEAYLVRMLKGLKDWKNNPSVKAGAGGDSRVRADCDFEVMSDDEMESIAARFKANNPSLALLSKDYVHVSDRRLTWPPVVKDQEWIPPPRVPILRVVSWISTIIPKIWRFHRRAQPSAMEAMSSIPTTLLRIS